MFRLSGLSKLQAGIGSRTIIKRFGTRSAQYAITNFNMPSMSPTMTEGSISRWNIKEGDSFNQGDVLMEIETDKAQIEVEAAEDGIMAKILYQPSGDKIAVGQPIAILAEEGDDLSNLKVPEATSNPAKSEPTTPTSEPKPTESKPETPGSGPKKSTHYSPAVAHLLSNYDIKDINNIPHTGPKGLLAKGDILAYIKQKKVQKVQPSTSKPAQSKSSTSVKNTTPQGLEFTDIPTTNMRKVIASRLSESKSTVPHAYTSKDIPMNALTKLRQTLISSAGVKVSVNDFLIKAVALALRDVPEANVKFNSKLESTIERVDAIDISVAVATPTGLITPIIKDADKKGIKAISDEIKDLAGRAKINKLKPHEYQGGSFSISNLGMFGIKEFTAIINPPQACILAVSSTRETFDFAQSNTTSSTEVLDQLINPFSPTQLLAPKNINTKPVANTSPTNDIIDELIDLFKVGKPSGDLAEDLISKKVMTVTLSSDERVVDQSIAARFLDRLAYYLGEPNHLIL